MGMNCTLLTRLTCSAALHHKLRELVAVVGQLLMVGRSNRQMAVVWANWDEWAGAPAGRQAALSGVRGRPSEPSRRVLTCACTFSVVILRLLQGPKGQWGQAASNRAQSLPLAVWATAFKQAVPASEPCC